MITRLHSSCARRDVARAAALAGRSAAVFWLGLAAACSGRDTTIVPGVSSLEPAPLEPSVAAPAP
ncbi:MAG TPA: hypothetical protein VMG12_04970, partial [Polyangiaceae bacterium]|nr:hypothetical protein [Polyangiaceae bacterium]